MATGGRHACEEDADLETTAAGAALASAGTSAREIGRLSGVAHSTVQDALKPAQAAKVGWPLPVEVTDEVLEQKLFTRADVLAGVRRRREPWATLVVEMKKPAVTMMMPWRNIGRRGLTATATAGSTSFGC